MAAPAGNKFAEKWTRDKALELARSAYDMVSGSCYFISEVADKCDTYRDFFTYILEKFNDDEEVFRTIKKMQNKCESIIARKTAAGDIVPSLGIFILKSYHGLTETSKYEHKVDGAAINVTVENKKAEDGLSYILGDEANEKAE
jgi:hypothetical protein